MRVWISIVFAMFLASCTSASDSNDPPDPGPDPQGPGDPGPGMDDDDDSSEQPGTPDAAFTGGPSPDAAVAGPLCAEPGATGNSKGVGEYCTAGGGECDDNDGATYCTIDYQDGAPPFCTMVCFGDSTCAEGASCESDGGSLSGCTPSCLVAP